MSSDKLYDLLQSHCDSIRTLVDAEMLHDGDTAETSQRICVLNQRSKLEHAINGSFDSEMKK